MDLFCSDRKLSELGDGPLGELLDNDVFTPQTSVPVTMDGFGMENSPIDSTDWLDNFFDDPVLNDRMISDALQPNVQSEHSYSLANGNEQTLDLSKATTDKEVDMDLTAVNPNHMTLAAAISSGSTPGPYNSASLIHTAYTSIAGGGGSNGSGGGVHHHNTVAPQLCTAVKQEIKQEPLDLSLDTEMTTVTVARSSNPQTLLKQPTIILATTSNAQPQLIQHSPSSSSSSSSLYSTQGAAHHHLSHHERLVLPKASIKMEPVAGTSSSSHRSHPYHSSSHHHQRVTISPDRDWSDSLSLPPTPPSSTNSDSEGGSSPGRSPPSSPVRGSSLRHHHSSSSRPISPQLQQPFFMSPIPTSGVLVLTEEEKRTLVSEGYPIPAKLPLTKQEEKNLKKIRRKIKNKISAQESRRKKKEYLETLERKVESFSQENTDLRKKMDNLQNNNQSLLSQLQKLQSIVRGLRPSTPTSTQGTCLMVMVLCFAVFLGSWSPMSLSIGYGSVSSMSPAAAVIPSRPIQGLGVAPQQPQTRDPTVGQYGAYATPNMRSRVLMSVSNEDEEFGPHAPFSYKSILSSWFGCYAGEEPVIESSIPEPFMPKVNILDVESEINQTGDGANVAQSSSDLQEKDTGSQALMHPDISVTTTSKRINATA